MTRTDAVSTVTQLDHLHGHFYFADLHTPDVDDASAFYAALFGWEFSEIPGAPNRYRPASIDGRSKAAITGLIDEQLAAGTPPYWFPYLYVSDIDQFTARIAELGGSITTPIVDVFDFGRMATAVDPTGAAFGVWQDLAPATSVFNEHGSPFWYEAHSTDVDASLAFYTQLLDWQPQPNDMGSGVTYYVLETPADGPLQQAAGGMMQQMSLATEQDVPSLWGVYFNVDDVDATAELAVERGGRVLMGPMDIPDVGRSAALVDPQGALFQVMKPLPRTM